MEASARAGRFFAAIFSLVLGKSGCSFPLRFIPLSGGCRAGKGAWVQDGGDAFVDSLHENRLLRQRNKKDLEICYDM